MIDPSNLAGKLVSMLAPALPYLLKGGEIAAASATKKLGEDTWMWAKGLWGKLRPNVESKPAALKAANELASTQNEQSQEALSFQLERLLSEDSKLAFELARLLDEAKAAGLTVIARGERSVAIGREAPDAVVITGDQNVVQPRRRDESDKG